MFERSTKRVPWLACVLGWASCAIATGCAGSTPEAEADRDAAVAAVDAFTPPTTTDGGADAGPTELPPTAEAVARARAECMWIAQCRAGDIEAVFFDGLEGCVDEFARAYDPVLRRGNTAPPAQWCGATLEADADCDGVRDDDGTVLTSCVQPAGRLRSGEPCIFDVECDRSASGGEMRCIECQCRPLLREGDECVPDALLCSTGLECLPHGDAFACARPTVLPDGAACTPAEVGVDCAYGSVCFEGVCTRQRRPGESCEPDGLSCFDLGRFGLRCAWTDEGYRCPSSIFPTPIPPGEPCAGGDVCVGGYCPPSGICPFDCRDEPSLCVTGECRETTGQCALRVVCHG